MAHLSILNSAGSSLAEALIAILKAIGRAIGRLIARWVGENQSAAESILVIVVIIAIVIAIIIGLIYAFGMFVADNVSQNINKENKNSPKSTTPRAVKVPKILCPCPNCDGNIIEKPNTYGCDSWKSSKQRGCGTSVRKFKNNVHKSTADILSEIAATSKKSKNSSIIDKNPSPPKKLKTTQSKTTKNPAPSLEKRLKEIDELKERGIITDAEHRDARSNLLRGLYKDNE